MMTKPDIKALSGESRIYRKPTTQIKPLTEAAKKYLNEKRGLNSETLEAFGLGCTDNGKIAIPFKDENGATLLIKFRHAEGGLLELRRDDGSIDKVKTHIERGGKPILFGSNLCHPSGGPLVICFGEYDAMSVYQAGIPNAVSPPFGDKGFQFIQEQWDFLEQFDRIVLFPDVDVYKDKESELKAAAKLDELVRRLGMHRVSIVQAADRFDAKDANDLLVTKGERACAEAIEKAEFYPEPFLVRVADAIDEEIVQGRPSGYEFIDKNTGGLGDSDLVLIAGDNGAGKTTFALNLIAQSVDLRSPVLFWSGEQKVGRIRYWFHRIVAGSSNLKPVIAQNTGYHLYFPYDEFLPFIKEWYRDFFWQYTSWSIEAEKFLEVAELAVRRYGVKMIVIDNLMAFTGGAGEDYYRMQGDFVQSCKMFAAAWDVIVVLLVHNRKVHKSHSSELYIPNKDDIEGAKKITNWADIVLQLVRVPEAFQTGRYANTNGVISLCKNRATGIEGDIGTKVDRISNRITPISDNGHSKIYGWEKEFKERSMLFEASPEY